VKLGSFKVLSCQFGVFCLSFQSICLNLDVKYEFPLPTYYCNSSTYVPLEDGQSCSLTVKLVNSVTSKSVNLFNFAMWPFASKSFPIELVPCSDEWRRTWWQMIHMHQQKIFPSGRNGSVRVDALRQSRQRHPSGGLLRARRQFNASRSISPSDRCFTVSSRSVGLLF